MTKTIFTIAALVLSVVTFNSSANAASAHNSQTGAGTSNVYDNGVHTRFMGK